MLYTEKNRTGLVWSKLVAAWTLANVVCKAAKKNMIFSPAALRRIQNTLSYKVGVRVTVYG